LETGRAFLVLCLSVVGSLGCTVAERDPTDNLIAGSGGGESGTAGKSPGGAASAAAGAPAAAGTTTGGDATAGSPAEGGAAPMAGSDTGGRAGGSSAGTAGIGGGAGSGQIGSVPIDPELRQRCTGVNPIVCHLDAADGNWDVTLDLGSDTTSGNSRVAAETRHYLGDASATAAGAHQLLDFTVNVRMEKHDGGQSAPSNILDLVIDGSAPQLRGIGLRAAPKSITIFVAGDSTLCDWIGTNTSAVNDDETGWAQALAQYFAPGVAIANYADSGETAGSFYGNFFSQAKAAFKPGDYVFVQFGHNDQKDASAVAAYKTNLMKYVQDARDKQATPVLFTPVSRSSGSDADPGFAGLDQQVRDLAAIEKVAYIDLTVLSRNYYATAPNKAALFADGGTHLSSVGASGVAGLVATAIKAGDLPLKSFVVVK